MKKIFLGLAALVSLVLVASSALMLVSDVEKAEEPQIDISQTATELTGYGSNFKFWFHQLSNDEKHAYNLILKSIYEMPEVIEINRIDSEMLDNVFYALLCDNPDLFFVGRKCVLRAENKKTWFSVDYTVDKAEYDAMKKELDETCAEITASFSNPEDIWQTELEIHDYVVDNCNYVLDDDLIGSTAYGVLVNGSGACEGYSKAAKLLMDSAGIESAVISGEAESRKGEKQPHMWNVVRLDGSWYHLDCTWDDPVDESGDISKTYTYFNLDNKSISVTHSKFSYDFGCSETKENYFIKTGAFFESYSRDDEKKLAEIIVKEIDRGNSTVYFRFADKETFDYVIEDMVENERMYTVLKYAKKNSDFKFSTSTAKYIVDDTMLCFAIVPEYRK